MKYRIKTFNGWWKGLNIYGISLSGKSIKDAKIFNSKDEAEMEIRFIPFIVGFDKIVSVKRRKKVKKS